MLFIGLRKSLRPIENVAAVVAAPTAMGIILFCKFVAIVGSRHAT